MITASQKVLEIFINKLFFKYGEKTELSSSEFFELKNEIRQAMLDWADAQRTAMMPWQFNPPLSRKGWEYKRPLDTWEFLKKESMGIQYEIASRVRPTGYDEISRLLKTSGCTKEKPYWIHSVLGVLETPRGVLVLTPGDWVIEVVEGFYLVLDDATYRVLYLDA
jgi:hypothetical protein